MLSEGFHDVPKGHVATIVTHLEMRAPPEGQAASLPDGAQLTRHETPDLAWYRDLFARVGAPWLWFSRLRMTDADLELILKTPEVQVWSLDLNGTSEGLLELDFREKNSCELAYFGLTNSNVKSGLGRAMMTHAITEAFAREITRFHVHTCTLDSPQALRFYIRNGFTPVRQQVEIAKDPRLLGLVPEDQGAHVPIFRP